MSEPGALTILVEFPESEFEGGVLSPVSAPTLEEQLERSRRAVDKAMESIQYMAGRVQATLEGISEPPHSVEVEFGITFSAEAGALIARASTECSISVKLAWQRK